MKRLPLNTLVVGLTACLAGMISAQTNYVGTGTNAALDIATLGNWDSGLPTSSINPGTISTNSSVNAANLLFTYTDYYITLTGGVMTQFNSGNDPLFSGGTFTVNGGTYGATTGAGRGFRNDASNVATLTSGKINSGSLAGANIQGGSSLTINGGEFQQWGTTRFIRLTGSSSLTVNPGGTLSMDTTATAVGFLGVNNLSSGTNTIRLNGGTTTANFLAFGNVAATPKLKLTLGGTMAGSLTAVNFQTLSTNEVIGARRIDWLPGTLMTVSVTNADEWAQAEWEANRLFYNGQSSTDLGGLSWADASNPSTGLGGGSYWVYNSATETLSLGTGTPPPVSNPFQITSFSAVTGEPGVWQATLAGDASTAYVFRSTTVLDFSSASVVENLTPGVPAAGAIAGTNNSVVTTNASGEASVRMTLTGAPADFVRAETAP
jgi:hypothetical protein